MGQFEENMGAIWEKIDILGILGGRAHWFIGQKSQNIARYDRSILMNSLSSLPPPPSPPFPRCNSRENIGTIWGKIDFLGMFGVNTH